jgi:hypothetical protein
MKKKKVIYNLGDLIENIMSPDMKNKYLNKQGEQVLYHFPEIIAETSNDKND